MKTINGSPLRLCRPDYPELACVSLIYFIYSAVTLNKSLMMMLKLSPEEQTNKKQLNEILKLFVYINRQQLRYK